MHYERRFSLDSTRESAFVGVIDQNILALSFYEPTGSLSFSVKVSLLRLGMGCLRFAVSFFVSYCIAGGSRCVLVPSVVCTGL
jgi:hypothetical protein